MRRTSEVRRTCLDDSALVGDNLHATDQAMRQGNGVIHCDPQHPSCTFTIDEAYLSQCTSEFCPQAGTYLGHLSISQQMPHDPWLMLMNFRVGENCLARHFPA